MAYVEYGAATLGGKQVAEAMSDLQVMSQRLDTLYRWTQGLGNSGVVSSTDFSAADGAAFNDTLAQINTDYVAFMTANAEKIARLSRGS